MLLIFLSKNRLFKITVLAAAIFMAIFSWNANEGRSVISWDCFGYYLYLPATFIHQDLDLSGDWIDNVYEEYSPSATQYQLVPQEGGSQTIKYSSGLSMIYAPGFAMGHLVAVFTDAPADGFSQPYEIALRIWVILFVLWGIWLFYRVIEVEFGPPIALLTTLIVIFGTNYLITAGVSVLMPHGILFTLYALMLRACQRFKTTSATRWLALIAACFGLLTLCRPTEIISILVPLFYMGPIWKNESLVHLIRQRKQWILSTAVVLFFALVQMAYWKYTAGRWIYFSYDNPGEGLDLFSPHVVDVLFSYRKGWLLWSPMCAIAILCWVWVKHPFRLGALLFIALNIWLISSWSTWWFGSSFGQRPFVQSYPLLFFGFAAGMHALRSLEAWKKIAFSTLVVAFLFLSIFQSWQFMNYLVPEDRITKKYYWKHFLATEFSPDAVELLMLDRTRAAASDSLMSIKYKTILDTCVSPNGTTTYPFLFRSTYSDLTAKDHLWAEITYLNHSIDSTFKAVVDMSGSHNSHFYGYHAATINNSDTVYLLTPVIRQVDDFIQIQISGDFSRVSNMGLMKLRIHEPKFPE